MFNQQEVARKRSLIIEHFYPALIEATISVDESKALISAMGTLLMDSVLNTMKEKPFIEINTYLHKMLCSDGERSDEIKKLLDTLNGENLYVAREIIEGATRAIDQATTDEMKERSLSTLKTDWDRYLR